MDPKVRYVLQINYSLEDTLKQGFATPGMQAKFGTGQTILNLLSHRMPQKNLNNYDEECLITFKVYIMLLYGIIKDTKVC